MKTLYRYEIRYTGEDGDTKVYLREFPVERETKHTYFIDKLVYGIRISREKRISKTAYNTFAYDTKEKAKDHFVRRTQRRIEWFKFWSDECKRALKLIKHFSTV